MGQKVNPHGLRVGVINGWDSRWFAKDELVGDLLVLRHAHSADLHDLAAQRRGQRLLRAVGPGPRLVPLHIQNDILHTV